MNAWLFFPCAAACTSAVKTCSQCTSTQTNTVPVCMCPVLVLCTCRKCSEDRFDTMVQLIQKVLQLYAAKQLRGEESAGIEGVVNQVGQY